MARWEDVESLVNEAIGQAADKQATEFLLESLNPIWPDASVRPPQRTESQMRDTPAVCWWCRADLGDAGHNVTCPLLLVGLD